ncbi:MAG TPA: carbohydrate-binding family 9-like protein [Acidobacteriaceae bacterium]|nr:carbohydrate-binding family 9-like protein [Acidobacteriaceae bacterium]
MLTRTGCVVLFALIGSANLAVPESVLTSNGATRVTVKMILTSGFIGSDFVPDGNLEKEVWTSARKIRFDQDAFNRKHYPEIETTVASRWTNKYLYLAYWCRYKTLNFYPEEDVRSERWELWKRDVVEAFIAPQSSNPNHYYEFEVAPNNQWLDLEIDLDQKSPHNPEWNSGFEHATRIDAARHIWTVEMRIPVRSMGVRHSGPGPDWRINLFRAEGVEEGPGRRLLSWSKLPVDNGTFHQPAAFGTLEFALPES